MILLLVLPLVGCGAGEKAGFVPGNLSNGGLVCSFGKKTFLITGKPSGTQKLQYIEEGKLKEAYLPPNGTSLSGLQISENLLYFMVRENEGSSTASRIPTAKIMCLDPETLKVTEVFEEQGLELFCFSKDDLYTVIRQGRYSSYKLVWIDPDSANYRTLAADLNIDLRGGLVPLGERLIMSRYEGFFMYNLKTQSLDSPIEIKGGRPFYAGGDASTLLYENRPNLHGSALYRYSFETGENTCLTEGLISVMNSDAKTIYYCAKTPNRDGTSYTFYAMDVASAETEALFDLPDKKQCQNINIAGGRVYITYMPDQSYDANAPLKEWYVYEIETGLHGNLDDLFEEA